MPLSPSELISVSILLGNQISSWSLIAIKSPVQRFIACSKFLLKPIFFSFTNSLIRGSEERKAFIILTVWSFEQSSTIIISKFL
ncbi:hypothetical protein D3C72_550530 [compost metagenome]